MFVQPHDDAFNFGVDLYLTDYMYMVLRYTNKTSEDKLKTLQCALCQNISVKMVVLNCVDGADAHHFGRCCFARIYPKGLYVRLSSKQTK